jgi:integrase
MREAVHSNLKFSEAAERWLSSKSMSFARVRYVSPRTLSDLRQYVRALNRKFGHTKLKNIGIRLVREYQVERAETCGPNKINQELGTLVQIMKRGGAWGKSLQICYQRLKREHPEVRRAMTPEEQEHFLVVAASREEWKLVYHYAMLALATSASHGEMRGLLLRDVNLERRVLCIGRESAKNRYRVRTIPLPDPAVWAANHLIDRASLLGATAPSHCLFPFRVTPDVWDPNRPMSSSGLRKSWEAVRNSAGVPWLRIHDLRHTAITRMAEAGVPLPIIMGVAGHITPQMNQHYTSVGMFAKRQAVETISFGGIFP